MLPTANPFPTRLVALMQGTSESTASWASTQDLLESFRSTLMISWCVSLTCGTYQRSWVHSVLRLICSCCRRRVTPRHTFGFTVVKQRLTTPEAIAKLARAFQVPSKTFSFCGMKDRWGITTQRISFPSSILVREPQVSLFDSMALGNAFPEAHKARLGGHGGNEFTVVLRRVTTDKSPAALDTCIDALKTGFPNYFGLQRFGTGVVPSSEMGVALLQKNFKHVVELLLGSRARRGTTFQAYCEASRGNFREALALTPTSCLLETSVPPPNSQSAFETRCVAPLAVISCTGSIHLN